MPRFNWKRFEDLMVKLTLRATRKVMREFPEESFYAVAFHEFYSEQYGVISLPCLAANTVEELDEDDSVQWSSADWYWTDISYANKEFEKLHQALQREAQRDVERWQETKDRFIEAVIKVAKSLYARLREDPQVTASFGVFAFVDGDDDAEILQRCISKARFKKLFPRMQEELDTRQAIQQSPVGAKLLMYREALWEYRDEVLSLGEDAIVMLVEALKDPEDAWQAAGILGRLGIPDKRAIAALRKQAKEGSELKGHQCTALALLGDIDFLLKLADVAKTRTVALQGLTRLYGAEAEDCLRPLPLDYEPVTRLLAKASCKRRVKELPTREIGVDDVDEALRGMRSKHKVIREHAVCAVGDRSLGKAAGGQILPALVERLRDRSPNVRRLAIIQISYWKRAARPYASHVRKLFKDPDPDVRWTARHYVEAMSSGRP